VSRIIQSSNPGERQASALFYACLCQFHDKKYIVDFFKNDFVQLFQLLLDSDYTVRKNTLNGFIPLSEAFGEVFLSSPNIQQVFSLLVELAKKSDEDTRILSLTVLGNLTDLLNIYANPINRQFDAYLRDLVCIFQQNLKQGQANEAN